ncbi:MAG: shikimate kinase [Salana multivorans]|uniref:shikimate kinase n=1 Tax=Salana multivorans TaxID=120377 RepID=UPI000A823283|nr:shikimate kinase [Salana multivorans]MBN8881764.1 shikimate kinase [Salana multivorans]
MTRTVSSIVLVGVPGAGSTSVGAVLADRLGVELRDTERLAAGALGHDSVSGAFVVAGEEAFHDAETTVALAELAAIAAGEPRVLVLGSGVLAAERVREAAAALEAPGVVELTVTLAHAAPRLGLSLARPVFLGNPRAQWSRLAEERRALYARVVRVVVDTDDADVEEVAGRVLDVIAGPRESDDE